MHIFDELDHKLVSILREDGRAPISKLGKILKRDEVRFVYILSLPNSLRILRA